jgi:protein-S-isoprenylcysteine O-methyltransferase Ste14
LIVGIGLISPELWLLLLALPASFAVQKLAIEREERHLATLFGMDWEHYTQRVRRWL